jgi:septal ring factor EnvC (AmiA/AmiB activator)
MAEEVDLRFLGEQIKRLQGDVRQVKSDMAQIRADNVKVESDVAALKADLTRIENKLEGFRESVDDRFDQNVELLKSSFRTLADEIRALKKS